MFTTVNSALAMVRMHGFGFAHHEGRGGGVGLFLLGLALTGALVWALSRGGRRTA